MRFKTPTAIAVGVVSALAGVTGAALALPSSPPEPTAAIATPTPTPEVRAETVRRTIHVTKRDRSRDDSPSRAAATTTPVASSRRSRGSDDSGHHTGTDDSGHHGGGHGRGRGRGGDDD
jgi:hypothetical protein